MCNRKNYKYSWAYIQRISQLVVKKRVNLHNYLPMCLHWDATFVSNLTAIHIFYLLIYSLLKGKRVQFAATKFLVNPVFM